jgi:hypothetical protein
MTQSQLRTSLAIAATIALAVAAGCSPEPEELPAVKTTPSVGAVCQQPQIALPGQACAALDACNVPQPECGQSLTVVVGLDSSGSATRAFLRERHSTDTETCLLSKVRALTFIPGRDCAGHAVSAEYVEQCGIICDVLGTEE